MKRFLSILSLFLCFALPLFAQSQQQVIVQEYREKSQKSPLEGVSLTVQNAGSSISNAQGNMTLQFRTLKAGDAVQVRRIDFSGYEIFNKDAVDQWTISPQKPFLLILCNSTKFKALRDQYMRVSSQSYERQYKKDQARLSALLKENRLKEEEYQQQLTELENNYYDQLDNLENYVDRFARIDLSDLSSQEQHLVELVQEGMIDEAIQLYESSDYLSKYQTQVEELKEISHAQSQLRQVESEMLSEREKVQAAIERQVQTYQLAGGQENFRKVTSLLKGLADADTTNIGAVWEYGKYCMLQNKFEECEKYMNIYLRQTADSKSLQATACGVLGSMYASKSQFEAAEIYSLKAVSLAQACVDEDSVRYDNLLIEHQKYLHQLYTFLGQPENTVSFSASLVDKLEKKYAVSPDLWWDALSSVYGEQGINCLLLGEDASKAETLMLKFYNMVKENDPNNNLKNTAINYLLQLYYMTEQWQKMEPFLLENLESKKQLYEKNPEEEVRYLFGVYNNLTELYCNLENYQQSHLYLVSALGLIPEMQNIYDEMTVDYETMNLYDTASQLYYKEGNQSESKKYAQLFMTTYEKMPEEYKQGLEDAVERNQKLLQ